MEQKGTLLSWKLSVAETLSFGVTIAALVVFATSTFQSKTDGEKLEKRIDRLETELSNMRTILTDISNTLSYIRGRLEPKDK